VVIVIKFKEDGNVFMYGERETEREIMKSYNMKLPKDQYEYVKMLEGEVHSLKEQLSKAPETTTPCGCNFGKTIVGQVCRCDKCQHEWNEKLKRKKAPETPKHEEGEIRCGNYGKDGCERKGERDAWCPIASFEGCKLRSIN